MESPTEGKERRGRETAESSLLWDSDTGQMATHGKAEVSISLPTCLFRVENGDRAASWTFSSRGLIIRREGKCWESSGCLPGHLFYSAVNFFLNEM